MDSNKCDRMIEANRALRRISFDVATGGFMSYGVFSCMGWLLEPQTRVFRAARGLSTAGSVAMVGGMFFTVASCLTEKIAEEMKHWQTK
ncbi:hypothetical protein [Asticcacaulis sp.]|uniref:hypothetical protein n=1 Tax=Asticcacaulis sp. TaxID=1872648 RepID=UPI00260DC8C0|nr:hypothetical protein [Asticcacaulis sp.]